MVKHGATNASLIFPQEISPQIFPFLPLRFPGQEPVPPVPAVPRSAGCSRWVWKKTWKKPGVFGLVKVKDLDDLTLKEILELFLLVI